MQEALTTPATRTRCARTSTGSPTFPRREGGTGGWSWGLVVREAAKHLKDHPQVAQGVEVGDVNPAVLTAEHHAVLALCSRDGLVEVRGGDGDVVHALALLRSEEHTSELQSRQYLVCRLLLEKKKIKLKITITT